MIDITTQIGIYFGLVLVVIYGCLRVRAAKKVIVTEDLIISCVNVLLSSVGVIVGLTYCYFVLTAVSKDFGAFEGARVPMFVGYFTMICVSGQCLHRVFHPVLTKQASEFSADSQLEKLSELQQTTIANEES